MKLAHELHALLVRGALDDYQPPPQTRGDVRCTYCGGLTGLYDCGRLERELGVSRRAAEAIMRELPKVDPPRSKLKKSYVRGEEVERLLREWERPA